MVTLLLRKRWLGPCEYVLQERHDPGLKHNGDESAFKRVSIVQDNKMIETEFHQDMLKEVGS